MKERLERAEEKAIERLLQIDVSTLSFGETIAYLQALQQIANRVQSREAQDCFSNLMKFCRG